MYVGKLCCDKRTQVLQGGGAELGHFVQQVVVELLAYGFKTQAQKAQVQHHAVGRIARAADADFGVVGVAVDAAAACGFNLALQGVGRVKVKTLADGELHGWGRGLADLGDLVGLQAQAPGGVLHAGVYAQGDVGRLVGAVHGLQEAVGELPGAGKGDQVQAGLGPHHFELLPLLLDPGGTGFGADAQPVYAVGSAHGAIAFHRDAKAARMQGGDQGGIYL